MGEMVHKMKKFSAGELEEELKWAEINQRWKMESMIEEAKKEATEEGMKEGMEKGIRSMILNLLKKNTDLDFISEVSGLSKEEVEKIKNSH